MTKSSSLPWTSFAPILAIHFLGTLGFSLAIPFLVFIVSDFGGASWTYGLLGATYSGFQLLGAPILGRWSDRTGRKPILVVSQVGTLAAWLLFLVAFWVPVIELGAVAGAMLSLPLLLIFVARALDGATGGNISVANAFVADLTRDSPEIRQLAFGRMGMAASLGFVVGPAAAGILGDTVWGPRLPVFVAAVFAAITTVAILLCLDEPSGSCSKGPPAPSIVEAGLYQQGKPCDTMRARHALWKGMRRGPVVVILIATLMLFLGFNLFYACFPLHAATAYAWTAGELGMFFALLSGLMIVAQGPLLALASKHLGRSVIFAIGMGFLALAFFCFQGGAGFPAYLGAACFAIGNGLSWPTFQAYVADVGGEHQGTLQGAVTSASSLASVVGLVVGGAIYPILGGTTFLVTAGFFIILLVLTPLWFASFRGATGQ